MSSVRNFPQIALREGGFIVLLTLALFMLLAMSSYSPSDPAWTRQGSDLVVHNMVGQTGAWVADVLFALFGWAAYLLPVTLVVSGISVFRHRREDWSWAMAGLRTSGWVLLAISCSVLLRIHANQISALPAGPGGMLGGWLFDLGISGLHWVGLTLAASLGAVLGSQMAWGFSWLNVSEITGRFILAVTSRIIDRVSRWLDARKDKRLQRQQTSHRKVAVAQEKRKRASRKAPVIEKAVAVEKSPRATQQRLFDLKSSGEMPDLALLDDLPSDSDLGYSDDALDALSRLLELKLKDFGVDAEVVSVMPGPVVTRFEIQPSAGTKVSRITGLVKDLARSLAVISVRVVEIIPGKSVVGIEIPNEHREVVRLKELLSSRAYQEAGSPLTLALGKDIAGDPVVTDITKTPHMLVAGTTGSGKSVGVNAMLLSLLYKSTPEDVRLILVDPKMLELAVYEGIPHLLTPVVTDMKEAAQALRWCVAEMERRYKLMATLGVRNLAGYNRKVEEAVKAGSPLPDPLVTTIDPLSEEGEEAIQTLGKLPLIVVVIDEFADMMMIVGKKVEQLIARIAQKARAAGIHLVLATQRPSVDVITGLIKANIPTRISFQVSSKVDSRTILDQGGAEQLLGHGDMLYLPPGTSVPIRVHGAFVSDAEVHRVVADWRQRGQPNYDQEVLLGAQEGQPDSGNLLNGDTEQEDELYDEAVNFVLDSRRASISAVQRKLRIGYNRAARLIEAMEIAGVVSEMSSNGSREVLVPKRD